jgi:hypothetical protein
MKDFHPPGEKLDPDDIEFNSKRVMVPGIGAPGNPPEQPPATPEPQVTLVRHDPRNDAASVPVAPVWVPAEATEQLRTSRRFYRRGFNAVGIISMADKPFCSGVLLDDGWAISAAHCFFTRGATSGVRRRDSGEKFHVLKTGDEQAYFVEPDGTKRMNAAAVESHTIGEVIAHPHWEGIGKFDLALVRLVRSGSGEARKYPRLAAASLGSTTDITLAAFGNTASVDRANGGMLEVGWQQASFDSREPLSFRWHYGFTPKALSTTCLMDSGGPIYEGVRQGYLKESHVLVGIISGISEGTWSKLPGVRDPCRGGDAINVRTDTDETRRWICQTTNNRVKGCPA